MLVHDALQVAREHDVHGLPRLALPDAQDARFPAVQVDRADVGGSRLDEVVRTLAGAVDEVHEAPHGILGVAVDQPELPVLDHPLARLLRVAPFDDGGDADVEALGEFDMSTAGSLDFGANGRGGAGLLVEANDHVATAWSEARSLPIACRARASFQIRWLI
nr:hypothetical protein [Chitinimonas koreensis]